jgi:glycosyltransferase involved in cell wall biosynthesis
MAYFVMEFWPSIPAGMIAADIAERLVKRGHTIELFVPNVAHGPYVSKKPLTVPSGLIIHCLGPRLSRLPASTISCSFLLFSGISAALRADVILSQHHPAWLVSFISAIISTLTRRPLVVRAEDVVSGRPNGIKGRLVASAINCCNLWTLRKANLLLVNSGELAEWCQRAYGIRKEKVGVSRNAVDTGKFSPENRDDDLRRRFASKHLVIYSGRLVAYRGLEILLNATAILKLKVPDIKVLFMGVGPDLKRIVNIAKSFELGDSVVFLGQIEPSLVPKYLASADIGIGPLHASAQTHGTNPVKVLEYMASGCVVVAAKNTVSAEILANELNGILIDPSPVELAASILRLFSDRDLAARLRAKARETVENSYDWEIVVSELLSSLYSTATAK